MHSTQHHRRTAPLPVPEVHDSSFGEFEAAMAADDTGADLGAFATELAAIARGAATVRAATLIAQTKRHHTQDGYTSWPAYADALETLVRHLCAEAAGAVR